MHLEKRMLWTGVLAAAMVPHFLFGRALAEPESHGAKPKPSLTERVRQAENDPDHNMNEPGSQTWRTARVWKQNHVTVVLPNDFRCIACHQSDLEGRIPKQVAQQIWPRYRKVLGLIPPQYVYSKLDNAFIMLPAWTLRQQGRTLLAQTGPSSIQYRAAAMKDPVLREQVVGHEMGHFTSDITSNYLTETWAHGVNLLSSDPSKLGRVDVWNIGTKYAGFLERIMAFRHPTTKSMASVR